jgi:hypothetical protein
MMIKETEFGFSQAISSHFRFSLSDCFIGTYSGGGSLSLRELIHFDRLD